VQAPWYLARKGCGCRSGSRWRLGVVPMQDEPWLHFWRCGGGACEGDIARSLTAAGVDFRACPPSAAVGDGIVCFAEIDDELFDFIGAASDRGFDRVLAIQASGRAPGASEAWQLLRAGATDVLAWSREAASAQRVKARLERWRGVDKLLRDFAEEQIVIGGSRAWRSLLRRIVEVARFTTASVLLIGESGTGKEVLAHLVNRLDPAAGKGELVVVDCTTIVPELSGSEFFGHERGAFTGAVAARDGAFALADGGSLFLDEIGELPLGLQAQLLRVVQERTYKRVGGNVWHRTEFRLVSATNRDLLAGIEHGGFRRDLYYRIAGWVFRVPPLRERREDILPLARHFLRALRPGEPIDLDGPAQAYLIGRAYAGNVRELGQLLARISHRHVGPGPITLGDIPEDERPPPEAVADAGHFAYFEDAVRHALGAGAGLREIGQAATGAAVRIALREADGNLRLAAQRLGITDRALQLRRANGRAGANGGDTGAPPRG
jgi:transcriptional regulator with GAF, ATPase, and Fis domain